MSNLLFIVFTFQQTEAILGLMIDKAAGPDDIPTDIVQVWWSLQQLIYLFILCANRGIGKKSTKSSVDSGRVMAWISSWFTSHLQYC